MSRFVPPSQIRAAFARAMSAMYQQEVPLYGTMLRVVAAVNQDTAATMQDEVADLDRVGSERHGAIRLGLPEEMTAMARLFAVMDMHPVGYYDLSVRDLPVHSTAFRPLTRQSLAENPFRVFTSLLQIDNPKFFDDETRRAVREHLEQRQIFTDGALALVAQHHQDGGLVEGDAETFVAEALETFRWHSEATASLAFYEKLAAISDLAADVVCFRGPHINHLTPRVLDMDELYRRMKEEEGIAMIDAIQGPPRRQAPILLRQTSFRALDEAIAFPEADGGLREGTHRARFGEIEARGIALTPAGRALYDAALASGDFSGIPDDYETLRTEGLAYFLYEAVPGAAAEDAPMEALVAAGKVRAIPMTYEDFLPVSAAGIFMSNLKHATGMREAEDGGQYDQQALEAALGTAIFDPFTLYDAEQAQSIAEAWQALGLR